MQPRPLVSIIIPTYGRPRFLSEAIESVVNQTYSNLEILVVDDCSPVPVRLPDNRDPRLKIFRHESNLGPGSARNTGLEQATGEFVTFLDDDDLFAEDRVERGVREIGKSRIHLVRSNTTTRTFEGDMRKTLYHGEPPSILQAMVRSEEVARFDPNLRVSEDIDWWLQMRTSAVFAWSDKPGLWIRQHDTPRPGVDPAVRFRCREAVAIRHAHGLDRLGRAHQFSRVSASAVAAGKRFAAGRYAARSILSYPTELGAKLLARSVTPSHLWARR